MRLLGPIGIWPFLMHDSWVLLGPADVQFGGDGGEGGCGGDGGDGSSDAGGGHGKASAGTSHIAVYSPLHR